MIFVTKLNGEEFVLNCDLIETIVEKPDTTIQLTTSRYVIVKESMSDVVRKVLEYRRAVYQGQRYMGRPGEQQLRKKDFEGR